MHDDDVGVDLRASGDGPLANSAQLRVVGTSRQIEMNENITLVISDPFLGCGCSCFLLLLFLLDVIIGRQV